MTVRFDQSLPALVAVLKQHIDAATISSGTVVRDVAGRLSYVLPSKLDPSLFHVLQEAIREALGSYARDDRVLVQVDDFGAAELLKGAGALGVKVGSDAVRLVDRRLVGADWLRQPAPQAAPPVRVVFASLKGGVGRSTALSVAAADLARKGKRVLAVDMDLEAPGLGAVLLDYDTLPPFGLLDALVENGITGLDDAFLVDLVGPSPLADRHGRIDVVPAFGRRSLDNPGDVLSKLARAYVEDVAADGGTLSIRDQVNRVLELLSSSARYDAIFIDARAGLHETAAAALLGLGAEVLLFGLDEPQTFQGYSALLSHLARFMPAEAAVPDWLMRMTMVQGKAPVDPVARQAFTERCRKMFVAAGLEKLQPGTTDEPRPPAGTFSEVPWDDDISDDEVLPPIVDSFRDPIAVLRDDAFRNFNPGLKRDLLSEALYRSSFLELLTVIDEFTAKG